MGRALAWFAVFALCASVARANGTLSVQGKVRATAHRVVAEVLS